MSFCCPFLEPCQPTCHSNIGVLIKRRRRWTMSIYLSSITTYIGHLSTDKSLLMGLKLRVWTYTFQEFVLGVDKLLIEAQTIESSINPPILKSLSKCNVAMYKVRYQGGIGRKQRRIHDTSKSTWKPIVTTREFELDTPKESWWVSLRFGLRVYKNGLSARHSCFTWDPSRCQMRVVSHW